MKINPNAQLKIQLGSDGNPKIYACGTQMEQAALCTALVAGICMDSKRPSRDNHQHHDSCRRSYGQNGGNPPMKIKSFVWYWLAMACFVVGLLYGMGLEGSFQTGGTVSDGAFITAMVLILLAIFFMRLGFYAADQEKKRSKKVHQQPRNTVKSGRKAG